MRRGLPTSASGRGDELGIGLGIGVGTSTHALGLRAVPVMRQDQGVPLNRFPARAGIAGLAPVETAPVETALVNRDGC